MWSPVDLGSTVCDLHPPRNMFFLGLLFVWCVVLNREPPFFWFLHPPTAGIQVRVHASLDEMDAVVDRLEQLQNGEEQSGVPSMVNYSVDTSSRPTPASSSSTAPTSTPGSSSSSSSAPTQCQEGSPLSPSILTGDLD
mgnify:CR=1 FL=1